MIQKIMVSTTETLSDIVNAMLQNNVNSVMITENKKTVGIISDRDLLKEIVENQREPKKTLVKNFPYTPLVILEGNTSMTTILNDMREKRISRVAVMKNGQLIGMLNEDSVRGKKTAS